MNNKSLFPPSELCHRRSGLGEEATKLIMAHGEC